MTDQDAIAAAAQRSLTLDQVLGNEPARAYLGRAWEERRLPQALLLTGPAGIGKTTMAYALARRIVADGGDPATHPRSLKVARGVHPDLIPVSPGGASGQIRIDEIRAVEDRTATAPLESPRKIVLIEPAEAMTTQAANCLLKLFEEPPPELLIILISAEPNRVLPTIRSRASEVRLEPVPGGDLVRWLMGRRPLGEAEAGLIAGLAEGRPGVALALCEGDAMGRRGRILEGLALLAREGFAGLFRAADALIKADPGDLLLAVTLLRDALLIRAESGAPLNRDLEAELAALAEGRSAEGLLEAAERLHGAAAEARYVYTPQAKALFIECLLIDVGRSLRKA